MKESKLKTRLRKIKNNLDEKALRDPKTSRQKLDKANWGRVNWIWSKRYEGRDDF